MAEASIEDVREVINTDLDDIEISDILERAARAVSLTYEDGDFVDLQHRSDFEATLAAIWIAGGKDRRAQSVSSESASVTYEASVINQLRAQLARLDPGDEFGTSRVNRDSDRYVNSANNDQTEHRRHQRTIDDA